MSANRLWLDFEFELNSNNGTQKQSNANNITDLHIISIRIKHLEYKENEFELF